MQSNTASANILRIVLLVLSVLVLVGVGGYKFVTTSVLSYSKWAWALWGLLSTASLLWLLPKARAILPALKGRLRLANRFGLTIGALVIPFIVISVLLPSTRTPPTRSISSSVVEQSTPQRRGACQERLKVRDVGGTESICLRYWGGRLHGFTADFRPGDEISLEVVDHWLGEIVVGIRRNGAKGKGRG